MRTKFMCVIANFITVQQVQAQEKGRQARREAAGPLVLRPRLPQRLLVFLDVAS